MNISLTFRTKILNLKLSSIVLDRDNNLFKLYTEDTIQIVLDHIDMMSNVTLNLPNRTFENLLLSSISFVPASYDQNILLCEISLIPNAAIPKANKKYNWKKSGF